MAGREGKEMTESANLERNTGAETEDRPTKVHEWGSDSEKGEDVPGDNRRKLQSSVVGEPRGPFLFTQVPPSSFHCCFFLASAFLLGVADG